MRSRYEEVTLDTQGDGDMLDVTPYAQKVIDNAGLADGLCTVFVAHSTCGMTTIEHEPGCNADTNGHSHVRAALVGPSVTIPFRAGELQVGVWQKVVCIDFDDRPRSRKVVVQLLGE